MTGPYYQDDLVTLYHGDCREVAEWLDADVLVTDPPYGVVYRPQHRVQVVDGRRMNPVGTRVRNDQDTSVRDHIVEAWGDRPALVFGRWDVPRPAGTRMRLIWDKMLPPTGNVRMPWGQSDEEIYVLGAWPPIKPGGRVREGGKPSRGPGVLRIQGYAPGSKARPDHPTPKPVELLVQLIEKCPPGVIADPCAGSGPTLLAARQHGRRVIGVELEERYCELVASRLSDPASVLPALVAASRAGPDEVSAAGGDVALPASLAPFGGLGGVVPGVALGGVHEDMVARSHPATQGGAA